jgi:hypothetical protein
MFTTTSKQDNMDAHVQSNEYTAPELYSDMECHNQPPITQKIDAYSFGVLLSKISLNLPSSSPRAQDGIDPGWSYQLAENCTRLPPHKRPTMDEILMQIDGTF